MLLGCWLSHPRLRRPHAPTRQLSGSPHCAVLVRVLCRFQANCDELRRQLSEQQSEARRQIAELVEVAEQRWREERNGRHDEERVVEARVGVDALGRGEVEEVQRA